MTLSTFIAKLSNCDYQVSMTGEDHEIHAKDIAWCLRVVWAVIEM